MPFWKKKPQEVKPCRYEHDWSIVAFDTGYYTSYKDAADDHHHLRWKECKKCKTRGFDDGNVRYHSGIQNAMHSWIEQKRIRITQSGNLYFPEDYQRIKKGKAIDTYAYKPLVGIEKFLFTMKNDEEFKELLKQHMVKEAFEEFETVVKLHENL